MCLASVTSAPKERRGDSGRVDRGVCLASVTSAPKERRGYSYTDLIRGRGGIGRRARFRSWCPKGCGGSNPPVRTRSSAHAIVALHHRFNARHMHAFCPQSFQLKHGSTGRRTGSRHGMHDAAKICRAVPVFCAKRLFFGSLLRGGKLRRFCWALLAAVRFRGLTNG